MPAHRQAAFLVIVGVAACTDLSDLANGADPDASTSTDGAPAIDADPGTEGGTGGDAAVDAGPRCDPAKPFGAPVLVEGINSGSDETDARLSPDELTVYFASGRSNPAFRLWVATRPSRDVAFGPPGLVPGIAYAGSVTSPSITADGLTIFFDHFPVFGDSNVKTAKRATVAASFGSSPDVSAVSTSDDERDPFVAADGRTLLFTRDAPDGGLGDMFSATRLSTADSFDPPQPLAVLNDGGRSDRHPVLSADTLTIYFSSDRAEAGTRRIWRATRPALGTSFDNPAMVPELAAGASSYEAPSWISPDDCLLYLTSRRNGGKYHVFVAQRPL